MLDLMPPFPTDNPWRPNRWVIVATFTALALTLIAVFAIASDQAEEERADLTVPADERLGVVEWRDRYFVQRNTADREIAEASLAIQSGSADVMLHECVSAEEAVHNMGRIWLQLEQSAGQQAGLNAIEHALLALDACNEGNVAEAAREMRIYEALLTQANAFFGQ